MNKSSLDFCSMHSDLFFGEPSHSESFVLYFRCSLVVFYQQFLYWLGLPMHCCLAMASATTLENATLQAVLWVYFMGTKVTLFHGYYYQGEMFSQASRVRNIDLLDNGGMRYPPLKYLTTNIKLLQA